MTMRGPAAVIVLAAGEGARMRSRTPKVLHDVLGRAMLDHVLSAVCELLPRRVILVVDDREGPVARHARAYWPAAELVVQERRGGTGHAVRAVMEMAGIPAGQVVVTYGDAPLLRGQTLARLARQHATDAAAVTALTCIAPDPTGYGRILRDASGQVTGVIEEADANAAQRAITEINSGLYAFDGELLADAIKRLPTSSATGEEYLTDVLGVLHADGHRVSAARCDDFEEVQGVNDQRQLAAVRAAMAARIAREQGEGGHGG